jgi:hypothetical protein
VGEVWKSVHALEGDAARLAKLAHGLDGRRIRKQIFAAMGSNIETAKDPNKLTRLQIESAFRDAINTQKELTQ